MRFSQHFSILAVNLCVFAGTSVATHIDDPAVIDYYANILQSDPQDPRLFHTPYANGTSATSKYLAIPLKECDKHCGSGMNRYPTIDIQSRFATWIVPLFLLIGSLPFAPLGTRNMVWVIVHLLADPISSFESQVSRLAYLQRRLKYCHSYLGQMPDKLKKAIAMITIAHEDSGPDADQEVRRPSITRGRGQGREQFDSERFIMKDPPALLDVSNVLLGENALRLDRKQQLQQIHYLEAANQLSDVRNSALSKAAFGVLVYLVTVAAAFVHVSADEFDDRTGHSVAMAVLYSWLVPAVLLGALVGGFGKRQSAGDILARLYQRSAVLEERDFSDGFGQAKPTIAYIAKEQKGLMFHLCTCSTRPRAEQNITKCLQMLEIETEHSDYSHLCWSGGNITFRPRKSPWGKRKTWITAVAHLPVISSVLCAFFISYTSPTMGLGCRSLLQLVFGAVWVISACATEVIRNHTQSARKQWHYVLIKDTIILLPQSIIFFAVFFGLFNSCFCWSAWFSLGSKAHVLLKSSSEIKRLAATVWPALTVGVIGSQLILLGCIWYAFRKGAGVFHLPDEERYKIPRRERG